MRALVAVALAAVAGGGALPGAETVPICAAAGAYWPTMTLALDGDSAWIACKEQSRVIRVATSTGRTTRSVRLRAPAIAVAAGAGAVWALDASPTLYRIGRTGAVVARVALPVSAAYNIWIGGGSVWVADDQGAQVVRVSPRTNRVVATVRVGDGPASMAFAGRTAWVIDHRDRTIVSIDLRTNRPSRLTTLGGDAPERMAWARGSLWITGRGTDLLQVDPADGTVVRTIEIGASGIDVAAAGANLWVPVRDAATDARGFPTMTALVRVSLETRAVTRVATARGRVDVHGLAVRRGAAWLADTTNGVLYRVP
jgi:DNA-binding beta-propeller fold protein YncE